MNERLINYALDIIIKRTRDDENRYSRPAQWAYNSAAGILMAAIKGDEETLKKFDNFEY